ncbi:ATP-binding protein [Streptomyces gobiensis]|nr:ATP-binding protein [Streptomyces gobiensis]UGY94496.1 ATP-binding protein [Streptomyces gobiensis]
MNTPLRQAKWRFTRHRRSVPLAREMVRSRLEEWGHPQLVETAELLITELMTNSYRHAKSSPGREIAASFTLNRDHFLVEVSDASDKLPHKRLSGPGQGHGLQLVDALADDWGVRRRVVGKTVWFLLKLPANDPETGC